MIKVYILQHKSSDNKIICVSFRKQKVLDFANRFLCHHTTHHFVCHVWAWGKEIERFEIADNLNKYEVLGETDEE